MSPAFMLLINVIATLNADQNDSMFRNGHLRLHQGQTWNVLKCTAL